LLITHGSNNWNSALDCAYYQKRINIVKFIIQKGGKDLLTKNKNEWIVQFLSLSQLLKFMKCSCIVSPIKIKMKKKLFLLWNMSCFKNENTFPVLNSFIQR